jgi:hypothetical protein
VLSRYGYTESNLHSPRTQTRYRFIQQGLKPGAFKLWVKTESDLYMLCPTLYEMEPSTTRVSASTRSTKSWSCFGRHGSRGEGRHHKQPHRLDEDETKSHVIGSRYRADQRASVKATRNPPHRLVDEQVDVVQVLRVLFLEMTTEARLAVPVQHVQHRVHLAALHDGAAQHAEHGGAAAERQHPPVALDDVVEDPQRLGRAEH